MLSSDKNNVILVTRSMFFIQRKTIHGLREDCASQAAECSLSRKEFIEC